MTETMETLLGAMRFDLSLWRTCSWCKAVMMPGNPDRESHGMCEKCAESWGK